jgi:hypothetical protein
MTIPFSLRAAAWTFSQLASKEDRDAIVGDLFEEFELRATTASTSAATRWCLQQVIASAPGLLWAAFRRGAWTPALIVALLGYLGAVAANLVVGWALMNGPAAVRSFGMLPLFPIIVLIVYFAARYRRSAAVILGALITITVAMMPFRGVALWVRLTAVALGPVATFLGCALQSLRRSRP